MASVASRVCKYCKLKAVNGPKCINCETVFHPGCVSRLNLTPAGENGVICCNETSNLGNSTTDQPVVNLPTLLPVSNGDTNPVISFLKSQEFSLIVAGIVEKETVALRDEITHLREEITNLKSCVLTTGPSQHFVSNSKLFAEVVRAPEGNCERDVSSGKKRKQTDLSAVPVRGGVVKDTGPMTVDSVELEINTQRKELQSGGSRTRTRPKGLIIGTGVPAHDNSNSVENDSESGFVAVTKRIRKVHLHLTRVNPAVDTENITAYISRKLLSKHNDANIANVEVLKLNSRYPQDYSSFKVTTTSTYLQSLLEPDFWPSGVAVRKYFDRSQKSQTNFREGSTSNRNI